HPLRMDGPTHRALPIERKGYRTLSAVWTLLDVYAVLGQLHSANVQRAGAETSHLKLYMGGSLRENQRRSDIFACVECLIVIEAGTKTPNRAIVPGNHVQTLAEPGQANLGLGGFIAISVGI